MRLEKGNKVNKGRILRDIINFFEHKEDENYYKPVRVSNFWITNYIEYEIKVERNNPENSFTTIKSELIPSGFSMSTISSFKSIENKHDVYRGKDYMNKFCESLREQAMNIINFRKKK